MADQIPSHPTPTIGKSRPRGLDRVGTPVSNATIKVTEYGGNGPFQKTVFEFTATPLSLFNATANGNTANSGGFVNGTATGVPIYAFPRGKIHIKAAASYLAFTTTSTIASTLNSGVTVQYGFGTAYASAATLATTMINVLAGTGQTPPSFVASTVINVASAAVTHHTLANPIPLDGSAAALGLYFNLGVATDGDLDADATLTVTGTLVIEWSNLGGFDFANV